jgi:hypothetical protein
VPFIAHVREFAAAMVLLRDPAWDVHTPEAWFDWTMATAVTFSLDGSRPSQGFDIMSVY